ncbi:MAG: hypothetical protein RLZZ283_791 [Candidatus Parcubacteria bacterium]|jgi:hypothetical protein
MYSVVSVAGIALLFILLNNIGGYLGDYIRSAGTSEDFFAAMLSVGGFLLFFAAPVLIISLLLDFVFPGLKINLRRVLERAEVKTKLIPVLLIIGAAAFVLGTVGYTWFGWTVIINAL